MEKCKRWAREPGRGTDHIPNTAEARKKKAMLGKKAMGVGQDAKKEAGTVSAPINKRFFGDRPERKPPSMRRPTEQPALGRTRDDLAVGPEEGGRLQPFPQPKANLTVLIEKNTTG